nr:glycerophosphodiester phosphodiesterase family protein [Ciceribacter sp. L1K23]
MIRRIMLVAAIGILALWIGNTSLFSSFPDYYQPRLIAHRGVHQIFDRSDLDNDTCTAERIYPPTHAYLENTLPSMAAAFEAGADVVELDVHLTPDEKFAVFHDWTLDCRTDLSGVTEETPFSELARADIGHGYTADGGKTFPLRGKGVGMMPDLGQVFAAFPDKKFLINFKSRRTEEGTALVAMLDADTAARQTVFGVYGGDEPTDAVTSAMPGIPGYTRTSAKDCLLGYLALGWSGHVPDACRGRLVPVPINFAPILWGWPERFQARMAAAGSEVILLGPYGAGDPGSAGIDTPEDWADVPKHFPGYVWTNRIENARQWMAEAGLGPAAVR